MHKQNMLKQAIGRAFALVLAATMASAQPAPAHADVQSARMITVTAGSQKLLHEPQGLGRVAIGNPKIADVNLINGRDLLVSGKETGSTSLLLWPAGKGAPVEYQVVVSNPGVSGIMPDMASHRSAVVGARAANSAGGPNANTNVIDRSSVALDTQVLSDVKIVDVQKTALQEFGFNFGHATSTGVMGGFAPGGITSASNGASASTPAFANGTTGAVLGSATGFLPISSAFNFVYAGDKYLGALSILEQQGLARTLAEPSLTAMSGQTASFLAGGEFPFPVVQNGGTGTNSITIEFKEFGIRLNLTPTVLAPNQISLKVAPEVSELDFNNGISLNGITVPGLDVRRTETTVELGDGESFVISGLVSNELKNNANKVPWLGDVPVLGAFFKNTSVNRAQEELIMIVTPHLVRPLARNAPQPELPGAATDQYKPDFAHVMFMETGDFGQSDHGYSR